MTLNQLNFLEDTRDILLGYDGANTEDSLKRLIDECRERLTILICSVRKNEDIQDEEIYCQE